MIRSHVACDVVLLPPDDGSRQTLDASEGDHKKRWGEREREKESKKMSPSPAVDPMPAAFGSFQSRSRSKSPLLSPLCF